MKVFRSLLALIMGRRPAAMQVAAICRDDTSGRVMLITSRGTGRWVIPKGWPMAGRTLAGAAAQEAWEEAGLCGRVDEVEIGRFTYDKVQDQGYAIPVQVRVFMMHVASVSETFPEVDQRERHWFTPTEAAGLVAEPGLARILTSLKGPASVLAAE